MENIERQTIEAVKKVLPAVVSIVISKHLPKIKRMPMMPFFGPFMPFGLPGQGLPGQEIPGMPDGGEDFDNDDQLIPHPHHKVHGVEGEKVKIGGGSGSIVHPDGLILTNKHVVFDTDAEYTVITNDEKEYKGRVISRDPINDVAVLKIDAKGLPAVRLGNSDKIDLGQTVVAIGNALGLFTNTVSKGIVSGLGRKISASMGQGGEMEHLRNVIQTDVAINQGNSGGPLINLDGEVVGINTAIIFGAQNIGFSLPINWAKADLEDIIKFGRIVRPFIGLRYVMLNRSLQDRYDLPVDYGALVIKDHVPGTEAVVKGSPADKAGIRENDIVLEINGEKLTEKKELADLVQVAKVGEEIEMTVMRKDKTTKIKTVLEERK
ncbi:MAG: trypsin-like peptidase domain-containing protein [Candidatus Yanofskybacteria bacterium]|nr:trypsin-like peptidase domain-containing protein [Candidatus Yanofskybacteria bacterium]